ncbi:DUF5753 domain-containing protein [Streptomyces beihaiensis]|uniref:DUF5753 domain-containing protein n=1 Tax=Streptomyces beihaiensis TaxID=2984495 RepID=A0ABT3U290_9ACTN|nr:DUF5753 domain-containing protein [Streptomyces beihaiensis]MCX3063423.1 DUF5753 domain-containing protein [Streptomyces beihaiensis]
MARQAALTRDEPISISCILDEATLRRVVGGPDIMRGQLQHLLDVTGEQDHVAMTGEHDHVAIQVLPFEAGAHAAVDGPFQVLHFPAGPPVAVVETKMTSLYLEEDGDVDRYVSALDTLRTKALDRRATRRFIEQLIKDCYT